MYTLKIPSQLIDAKLLITAVDKERFKLVAVPNAGEGYSHYPEMKAVSKAPTHQKLFKIDHSAQQP